jgi:hypothetical protein
MCISRRATQRSGRRLKSEIPQSTRKGPRDAMGRAARNGNFVAAFSRWRAAMPQPNDLSRSLFALDQNSKIIAVIELSHSSWLVAGMLPGIAIDRSLQYRLAPDSRGAAPSTRRAISPAPSGDNDMDVALGLECHLAHPARISSAATPFRWCGGVYVFSAGEGRRTGGGSSLSRIPGQYLDQRIVVSPSIVSRSIRQGA